MFGVFIGFALSTIILVAVMILGLVIQMAAAWGYQNPNYGIPILVGIWIVLAWIISRVRLPDN